MNDRLGSLCLKCGHLHIVKLHGICLCTSKDERVNIRMSGMKVCRCSKFIDNKISPNTQPTGLDRQKSGQSRKGLNPRRKR